MDGADLVFHVAANASGTRSIEEATGYPAEVDNITAITDDTYRLVSDPSKLRALGYTPHMRLADEVARLAAHLGVNPELPVGSTIFTLGQHAER